MHTGDMNYFDEAWGAVEDPKFYSHLLTYLLRRDLNKKDKDGRKLFDLRNLTQTEYKSIVTYKNTLESFIEEFSDRFYPKEQSKRPDFCEKIRNGYPNNQCYKDFCKYAEDGNFGKLNALTFKRNIQEYCVGQEDRKNKDYTIYWVIKDDKKKRFPRRSGEEDSA